MLSFAHASALLAAFSFNKKYKWEIISMEKGTSSLKIFVYNKIENMNFFMNLITSTTIKHYDKII